jgi:hypothetical protein
MCNSAQYYSVFSLQLHCLIKCDFKIRRNCPVSKPAKTSTFSASLQVGLEFSFNFYSGFAASIFEGVHSLLLSNFSMVESFSSVNSQTFCRVIGEVKERAKSGRQEENSSVQMAIENEKQ